MKYLEYVGLASIVGSGLWLTYLMFTKIRFTNPIKKYIKKIVLDYLKELQNG